MFSAIRTHLSYANVAATMALVFALTGGAFAATSHPGGSSTGFKASASVTPIASAAKKKSKAPARGPAGPRGATGPAGPAGAKGETGQAGGTGPQGNAGTNGSNGENGKEGTPGKEGKAGASVASTEFSGEKEGKCKEGGSEFKAGTRTTYACNGKEGSPWTAGGTLPPEKTETGVWAFGPIGEASIPVTFGEHILFVPVASFVIPLEKSPEAHYINGNGEEVTEAGLVPNTGACKAGTTTNPTAEPGNLCVYANGGLEMEFLISKTGRTGAIASFAVTGNYGEGSGTWAVTAPREA